MWKQNKGVDEGRRKRRQTAHVNVAAQVPKLLCIVSLSKFYTFHVSTIAHIRSKTGGRLVCAPALVSHPGSSRPLDDMLVNGM